jgi:hypothetical protein
MLKEILPSLLGPSTGEEPVLFSDFSKKVGNSTTHLERERDKKLAQGRVADGGGLAVLISGADKDGKPSPYELDENSYAVGRITRLLGMLGVEDIHLIPDAQLSDVVGVMGDRSVSDVLYVGHSDRANLVLPQTASWKGIALATDYLKSSFGQIGCADVYRGVYAPRAGQLSVIPDGLLYGKRIGETNPSEMGDLANFEALAVQIPRQSVGGEVLNERAA